MIYRELDPIWQTGIVGIASGSVRLPSRLSRDAIHTVSGTIKLMQPLEALGKAPSG